MYENWTKETCSNCGEFNWVCLGSPDQCITSYMPDGCKCWNCGHSWAWLDDDMLAIECPPDVPIENIEEYVNIETGLKTPE